MTQIGEEYINRSPYELGQFGDQLENMTAQEVFNIAVEHLLLQNKKSKDKEGACAYNGSGVCCVAAPFIKDYSPYMESYSWRDILHTDEHSDLIGRLQSLHDSDGSILLWPIRLKELAIKMGLETPQVLIDKLNTN